MISSNASWWHKLLFSLSKVYPVLKRRIYRFHGGVFPQYNKSPSKRTPLQPPIMPERLILPLKQHAGVTTVPLVKVGDQVLKNQRLADAEGLSAPIHAPTSGKIIALEAAPLPHASGLNGPCILLQPDQQDQAIDNALQSDGEWPNTPESLKDIIYRAGIVGMGGAGFPTFAKLPTQPGQIEQILINGAECEPFITCDDLLMQTRADEILNGARIVAQALGARHIVCGIEFNKPDALDIMQKTAEKLNTQANAQGIDIEVQGVPTVYPMGGQKQLTYELTGVETPSGHHAADTGLLMMNVATFAAIYRAVTFGEPLTRRFVTVSGLGLDQPFNIEALLGTPFETLAQAAKPNSPLNYPLIMGGPMMGFAVQNNQVPITKTTNCVLANPPSPMKTVMPCIRCGECAEACPVNLLPQQMYWHSRSHEFDKVEKLKVFDCIECGCCSFVCPSHIPLVQYYRHAKSEIKLQKAETQATDLAKQRHQAKLDRLAREQAEKEARLKAKKAAVKKAAADKAKTAQSSPTASAAARAKAAAAAKAKAKASAGEASGKPLSARDKAIAAAKAKQAAAAAKKAQATPKATPTETTPETAVEDKRKAAMAAAKARAAAKKAKATAEAVPTETTPEPTVEDKRKAAMAAAKARAAAKKAKATAEAAPAEITSEPTVEDKRKAAMAAAKARAAARKAAPSDPDSEQETS